MNGVDLIVTITDRSRSEEFISLYQDCGVTMIISALGHGTATGEILDYLNLEATEKIVLFCMTDHERTHAVVHRATKELWLDVPGNGILLTVPVSSIGGTATREYLLQEQPKEAGQKEMEKENTHELIVAIANRGSMDLVMRAARSAGATGGTVLHAKGTGMELAKKFFGVSLASEKEMVLILAREADKRPIMKAVMSEAGIQSPAQSIVFSLPVGEVSGLRLLAD